MRKPKMTRVKKTPKFPDGRKYTGAVEYRATARWVPGSYPTATLWKTAAEKVVDEIRADLEIAEAETAALGGQPTRPRVPTVAEFAGVQVAKGGRVIAREGLGPEQIWPWTHDRGGSLAKDTSKRRYAEGLRPFIRTHGDRPMDSFLRTEAVPWAAGVGQHTREAVRRLFHDAIDSGYRIGDGIQQGANPFRGVGAKKKKRKDDPDFRICTEDEITRLYASARKAAADPEYSKIVYAIVVIQATTGMRPGEIFGQHHDDITIINETQGYIDVFWQVDDYGKRVPVKNELRRLVALGPDAVRAYRDAPRIAATWAFPAPRGGCFRTSSFHKYWDTTRIGADMPAQDLYELKHRAITYMCTPPFEDEHGNQVGGLGLDPVTVATIVGHQDGGATIAKYYLRIDQKKAVERALAAWAKAPQPTAPEPQPQVEQGPRLRAVGE